MLCRPPTIDYSGETTIARILTIEPASGEDLNPQLVQGNVSMLKNETGEQPYSGATTSYLLDPI
jgi:hypothetical protein